jgi:hypothetical protein
MNNFEKLTFLEITNKFLGKFPNSDYLETYEKLNDIEKLEFTRISNEIHQIWNFINSKPIEGVIENENVNSIFEYHSSISDVNSSILKVCQEFDLDLKNGFSKKFENAVIQTFGKGYYRKHFKK